MRIFPIATALAVLAAPLSLQAAEPAKPAASEQPKLTPEQPKLTPEQQKANVERGVKILSLFHGALQNKEVPEDQKGYLFSCLYNNKLENLSVATGDVLAKNPKLDANDPKTIYQAAATICGVTKAPSFAKAEKPTASAPAKGR